MFEKEMAGIARFIIDAADSPTPYYWKVPENFTYPAVFFPPPEISTGSDTLSSYSMEYAWYIKLFASTDQDAYIMGRKAMEKIRMEHNLIPVYDSEGNELDEPGVRVDDPKIKMLDDGACQLTVTWISRRPLTTQDYDLMQQWEADITID